MKSVILSTLLVGMVGLAVLGAPAQTPDRKKQRQRQDLERELKGTFDIWIGGDVAYIIADEERAGWNRLGTAEEREQFIEMFWRRRDPTPDTEENEYKEEHYRRIAYANEHFPSGIPGWKSDRGRIYILHGPPDEIESHPSGGSYQRPPEEGGGTAIVYSFEKWRYRHIDGVGEEIVLEFVDSSQTGEYRLTWDPSEKDALLMVPNAGLTLLESMGQAPKSARFNNTNGTRLGPSLGGSTFNAFDAMRVVIDAQRPPKIRFKDLEAIVNIKVRYNLLPVQVRADFFRMTGDSVLTALTLQFANRDLGFRTEDGVHRAVVNVFGRVVTLSGRVVQTFEDVLRADLPDSLMPQAATRHVVYGQALPLRPGRYRLSLAVKDLGNGNIGTVEQSIVVPAFEEETLAASSLVLADKLERVATRDIGRGQFVIGTTKLCPSVEGRFRRDGHLGLYLQVYNLHAASTVEYEIAQNGQVVLHRNEPPLQEAIAQLTLERSLPLNTLAPGKYTLRVRVTDGEAKRTLMPEASFTVE